jgi:hypothetical protein
MVYRKFSLVFFSIFNVVFSEPFGFSALICFNEPFYIFALVNIFTIIIFFLCGSMWCFRVLCSSSFLFSTSLYVSMPLFASMRFFLPFYWVNLSTSMVCGLLGFYVGLLFYSNVILSEPLCLNDLFCFK